VRHSFAAHLGRAIEPVFRPLGYDWRLCIGVVTSFAAREVFVSTLGVVAAGSDASDDERVTHQIATMKRDDGVTNVFTPAVSWSLLVYFVLAIQCLPTLAVTAREAGGVKWAMLQLGWMSLLAYVGGLIAYRVML
jgi:ferrous iron transport protein B